MGLSKDILLTIKDYEVKLDKDIKFYEYDTINLCFSIMEYGIVVKNGVSVNKLMPIQALKAYMLIETPDKKDYAEATKIEDNKVVFNLGNKYSRFIGVGRMQIVIKDADGCRVTLPEFPFEIKESINTGWDDVIDVLETEHDVIIGDELGRPIETTKISEMDETDEITPQTYTMVINEDGNKKMKLDTMIESISEMIEFDANDGNYIHPQTHPASMITGLHSIATTGDYNELSNRPTNLSQFVNDLNLSNGSTSTVTISNTLDNYQGSTLNEKLVNMFNDINTNHKNTPMEIMLPSGTIEITSDLRAIKWTNKTFVCNGYLHFKNCNAIEFIQCQHNDIRIHASSSANIDVASGNIIGLINPASVASLAKRGYKITDCSYNKFEFNSIIGFTNAIEVYSEYGALGSFYNNIYFTAIWRCQRPIIFRTGKASDDTSAQSGWITEIYVHGGMFDCDDGILIGQEEGNRPASEPSDNYQGLKFYNVGVEHIRKQANGRGIYFLQGKNNAVINPRFEGSLGSGNGTSGAYILVEESGWACNNRIETSNYPINVDRVKLNANAKQLANPNYDNHAGSYIEGDLYDTSGFKCGYKAIATPGKMVYEAKNLSNYYLQNAKINTFNYIYSSTEFAKVKTEDGTIKIIGYTG